MNEKEAMRILIDAFAETSPNISRAEIEEAFGKKDDEESLKLKTGMFLAMKRYAEAVNNKLCPRCGLFLTPIIELK
jgi:hypothetical protein